MTATRFLVQLLVCTLPLSYADSPCGTVAPKPAEPTDPFSNPAVLGGTIAGAVGAATAIGVGVGVGVHNAQEKEAKAKLVKLPKLHGREDVTPAENVTPPEQPAKTPENTAFDSSASSGSGDSSKSLASVGSGAGDSSSDSSGSFNQGSWASDSSNSASSGSTASGSWGSQLPIWLWIVVVAALCLTCAIVAGSFTGKKKATKKKKKASSQPKPAAPEPVAEEAQGLLMEVPPLMPLATTSQLMPSYSMVQQPQYTYAAPATTAFAAPATTAYEYAVAAPATTAFAAPTVAYAAPATTAYQYAAPGYQLR